MALGAAATGAVTATEAVTAEGGITVAAGELVTCGVTISDASPSLSSPSSTSA